ncbi:MAG: hypothetical protein WCK62_00110 [Actinomycetes bacterium]
MSTEYLPGVCNIGPGEIKRRRLVGLLGLIATVATFIVLIGSSANRPSRLSIFIPAMIFATGWMQARKKFCLAFGLMGTFNFGALGRLSKVADPIAKRQDLATVTRIGAQALAIALLITVVTILLPF